MLREAVIICPKRDNDGRPVPAARRAACEAAIRAFGGVTVDQVTGLWRDGEKLYQDASSRLTIAAPLTEAAADALRGIARLVCDLARQEAVYLRLPSGEVEFITAA